MQLADLSVFDDDMAAGAVAEPVKRARHEESDPVKRARLDEFDPVKREQLEECDRLHDAVNEHEEEEHYDDEDDDMGDCDDFVEADEDTALESDAESHLGGSVVFLGSHSADDVEEEEEGESGGSGSALLKEEQPKCNEAMPPPSSATGGFMMLQPKALFVHVVKNQLGNIGRRTVAEVYEQTRIAVSKMSSDDLHDELVDATFQHMGWFALKGKAPLDVVGQSIAVKYEEDGVDVPHRGRVVGYDKALGLTVKFPDDDEVWEVNNDDDWKWVQ